MIWMRKHSKWIETPVHGCMAGLSAMLVCNGPSLAKMPQDISFVGPGRVVVAVNNAAPRVRPDWWVGMDKPGNYDRSIFSDPYPKLIHSQYVSDYEAFNCIYSADIQKDIPFYDGGERDTFRWDNDSFRIAIQLCLLLGCRTIHLVGVDLDNGVSDYADGNYLTEDQRSSNKRLYNASFEFLKWHIENRPRVRLISSSPESRINEIMEYVPAQTALKKLSDAAPWGRMFLHNSEVSHKADLDSK